MKKVLTVATMRSLLDGCGYFVTHIDGPECGGYAFQATPMDVVTYDEKENPIYPHVRKVVATTYIIEFDAPPYIYVKEFEEEMYEGESGYGSFTVAMDTSATRPTQV